MSEPTTAAGRLDAAWRELELDALASDGPIRDADVKNAIKRHRARIEAEAARPSSEAALREALRQVVDLLSPHRDLTRGGGRSAKAWDVARRALTPPADAQDAGTGERCGCGHQWELHYGNIPLPCVHCGCRSFQPATSAPARPDEVAG